MKKPKLVTWKTSTIFAQDSVLINIRKFLKGGECTNPRRQVAVTTKFCMVVPNICGPSVRNWLHVTFQAPEIFRLLLDFWKLCLPLL